MSNDESPVENEVRRAWSPDHWQDVTVVVGVSGGADSMALLRALLATQPAGSIGRLVVAHFNHRWRGNESDQDEQFVQDRCHQLDLTFVSDSASEISRSEDSARNQRHSFFHSVTHKFGARFLAMAHTADDQVETILHRIVRGTGIAGLAGIPSSRALDEQVTLIRPLLKLTSDQLRQYLMDLGESWREDSSNQNRELTRNRIRHELLPLLEENYNREVAAAVLRLGSLAHDCQSVIDQAVDCLMETVGSEANQITINRKGLIGQPKYVVCELLKRIWHKQGWSQQSMSQPRWLELANMILTEENIPARTLPGSIRAEATGRIFRLTV